LNHSGHNETSNSTALPSAAQLADARLKQWHQQGEALLTLENARSWINAAGLALFAPRPQIAAPAPSFVEAVLGAANPSPTIEQLSQARELLARLVAEGLAVPLNLLGIGSIVGTAGDAPDFVASTAVFSYIFTLRGDKAWKQPPASSGAAKVSHLALAAHEALAQRGALSAYDLTTELGKEVTEAAVLRALGELWAHLRVLPLPQPGALGEAGHATLWELSSARFLKQIKAGANAGQPTALSALISLYLGQAMVASEDEVESFLSPLAARSRIRDVVHALLSARQLDTVAIEGRTLLHVAGAPPAFLALEPQLAIAAAETALDPTSHEIAAGASAGEGEGDEGVAGDAVFAADEPSSRIAKFIPPPRKVGTGYLAKAKPAKFAGKAKRPEANGGKPPFAAREGARPKDDRERRPFVKMNAGDREGSERVSSLRKPFAKPGAKFDSDRTPRKPFAKFDGSRPPRKPFGKPGEDRPTRKPFGKPGEDRPARKPFAKFDASRQPRKPFGKPGEDRPARKPFAKFDSDRPSRKPFAKFDSDRPARKPFAKFDSDRPARKPFAKFDASRPPRKPFGKPGAKFDSDRPARGDFPPRRPRAAGDGAGFAPRKFAGKSGTSAGKPKSGPGGFAAKRPFAKSGKPFAGRPKGAGTKFTGGKKPFGKRPAGRKPDGRPDA